MPNYKNVVTIVIKYMAEKWTKPQALSLFGSKKGKELWDIYVTKYKDNPMTFFSTLSEEQQNTITMVAQAKSLARGNQEPINALYAMTRWPTYAAYKLLYWLLADNGGRIEVEQDLEDEDNLVVHDFPMQNGTYCSPVTAVEYRPNDRLGTLVVFGKYNDVEIKDYPSDSMIEQAYHLYQICYNSIQKSKICK